MTPEVGPMPVADGDDTDVPAITIPTARGGRSGWLLDAGLYGASAIFAAGTATLAGIPLQREWGWIAFPTYLLAAAVALTAGSRRCLDPKRRPVLAVLVFAGASLAPLLLATVERSDDGAGSHAQSEVIVIEEGANVIADGGDPYRAQNLRGPLEDRPRATRTHLPYPPGMLVFGIPRAFAGHEPWSDARFWLLAASAIIAFAAVRRTGATPARRLLVLQVLFVLPTGAALAATGGHDGPVLALLLLSLALADRGRSLQSGIAGGAALALKQVPILVVPLIAIAIARGRDRRRYLTAVSFMWLAVVVPFALWDPRALVEDVVLFPLGVGTGSSPAATPTLGALIEAIWPGSTVLAVALMLVAVSVLGFVLVARRPPENAAGAAVRAATLFGAALVLAPAVRGGLLVYPLNLLVWAWALADRSPTEPPAIPVAAGDLDRAERE